MCGESGSDLVGDLCAEASCPLAHVTERPYWRVIPDIGLYTGVLIVSSWTIGLNYLAGRSQGPRTGLTP